MRGDTILIDISVSPDRCDFSKRHYTEFIPKQINSYREFCDVFLSDVWSPIVFENNYRLERNFIKTQLCVIDVDEGIGIDDTCEILQEKKLWGIVAPTRSHGKWKKNNPPRDRYRVIMKFELPITNLDLYKQNIGMRLNVFKADKLRDGARYFYPSNEIYYSQDGNPLKIIQIKQKDQRQIILEKSFQNKQSVCTRYIYDHYKKLDAHIESFIKDGKYFGAGREQSCFVSACRLKELKHSMEDVLMMLKSSPFHRRDFSENEIEKAVRSAFKR